MRNNGLAAGFVALATTTIISLSPFFTTRTTTVVGAFIPYSPQQHSVVLSRPRRVLLGFHLQSECDCKHHHHRRRRDGRSGVSYITTMEASKAARSSSNNRIDTSSTEEDDTTTIDNNDNDSRLIQEPCNVVFTHTNADFDSLAAAVALSLLWQHEQPSLPTHVVLPRGFHPVVQRFLAFHKHLLPLRGFKTIMVEDVRALGVVDAQSAGRIGRGQNWLGKAKSIHVFDHHEGNDESSPTSDGGGSNNKKSSSKDNNSSSPSLVEMATELVIEHVGSTTTLLVERLQKANIQPAPHEATLFVLGIRADTGGLVYESTTLRDARALLWCLEMGASQVAISEFGVARVTEGQRTVLNRALRDTRTNTVHGMRLSSVLVSLEDKYVAGLAQVCEELLELTNSDVFLLGATHKSGGGGGNNNGGGGGNGSRKSKKGNDGAGAAAAQRSQWVSLIGRASPRAVGVDLNNLMRSLGGGGHTKAAAAALRCVPPPPPATTTTAAAATPPPPEEEEEEEQQEGDVSSSASSDEEDETTTLEERLTLATSGKLTASSVLKTSIDIVTNMIPEQLVASSFMVPAERIITVTTDNTVSDARKCFHTNTLKSAPVIDAQTGRFRGSLKLNDLVKAIRAGRSRDKLRGMMRSSVETVLPDTPLVELEELLVDKGVGRLPVVDDEGVLVGIVTRTDVLRQHKLYDESDLDIISGH